jgi:hypothetical protein
VVRPHPTENHAIYHEIAATCERVRVTNEGNVVPWLLAAKVLVHNSCTTGVEAYALSVPAVSYRATVNEDYDYGFYRLPNLLSHQCFDFDELRETLQSILTGALGSPSGDEQKALMDHHVAAQTGPTACERIVDVLEETLEGRGELPKPPLHERVEGWYRATKRTWKKRCMSYLPGSINRPEFQRHRYPGTPVEEVRARIGRFAAVLGDRAQPRAEKISDHLLQIRP